MILTPGKLYQIFQPYTKQKYPVSIWDITALNVIDKLNHEQIVMFIKHHPHNERIDGFYAFILYKNKVGLVATSFLREI